MNSLLTPGLYRLPALPVRATGPLARGDVALFLGYAVRGPVGVPVRVESPARFETLFGPRPADGFLWPAIKGFFETGGVAAYVLRLVDPTATAARADIGRWKARASFPWPMIDPRRVRGAARAAAAAWIQLIEAQIRDHGMRSSDPGTWGNALTVDISRSPPAQTEVLPDDTGDPNTLSLASLSGIEPASILELTQTQGDLTVTRWVQPDLVDRPRRRIRLPKTPAELEFIPGSTIRIATVEFRLDIRRNNRLEESFTGLSPDPRHSRSLADILKRECRSLHLDPPDLADWTVKTNWPAEGRFTLSGGTDGLTQMSADVWLDSRAAIKQLSEPALIALPDLVLPQGLPQPNPEPIPEKLDCNDIDVPPRGRLSGIVTAAGLPVHGARVDVEGKGGQATTNELGEFTVTGIEVALVTVRIVQQGFEPFEKIVQSSALDTGPVAFELQPLAPPRELSKADILRITQALANPEDVGPYKILIADPPAADTRLDELRSWRSQLGDTARIGLFGPWLRVLGPGGGEETLVSIPPSGHICGAFAAAELEGGIHRSGANRPLRFVEGLTLVIDDGEQGLLNPIGVNAIRAYPGRGIRANGTRTISSDPEWRFLTSRRVVDAIEKTLESSLAWLTFEPNNVQVRHAATVTVSTFLDQLWRAGVLAGDRPEAAYSVKCDKDNNTEGDEGQGRLTIDIGVAPTEPYEFVLFRLGSAQDALKVTE